MYIMKKLFYINLFLIISLCGCASIEQKEDTLFQVSTLGALMQGAYEGELNLTELEKYGDFGIGTFNYLDGEMIVIGKEFYQVKADGSVNIIKNKEAKTPFAMVTFFSPDISLNINQETGYKQWIILLNNLLPSKNIFYAIKIEGSFSYIKTRSVPRQERLYQKLIDIVGNQPTFEFRDIEGTIAGFWCPEYIKGVNMGGFHFHFISKDGNSGGHLLDCSLKNVVVSIDETNEFYMALPKSVVFEQVDLSEDKQKEIVKVEK